MEEYEKGYIVKCIPSCYPQYYNINLNLLKHHNNNYFFKYQSS